MTALFSIAYAHLYDAHGNAVPVYVSHVTADVRFSANAAYQPQPTYATQQSYSSLPQQRIYTPPKQESYSYRQQSFNSPKQQVNSHPQQRSSGSSNQLPYNLPGDFADSTLEHPIYYDATHASYPYTQKTISVLPTLHIPLLPSASSYQSHHPADAQNVDAQPSYYPTSASQSVLPSHNSGYASESIGSNDLYNSNSSPSGIW